MTPNCTFPITVRSLKIMVYNIQNCLVESLAPVQGAWPAQVTDYSVALQLKVCSAATDPQCLGLQGTDSLHYPCTNPQNISWACSVTLCKWNQTLYPVTCLLYSLIFEIKVCCI